MILETCAKAKTASTELARLSSDTKNRGLRQMADALENSTPTILSANKKDVDAARAKNMREALIERLALDGRKIKAMARCIREVSELPDPVGEVLKTWRRPNGLLISQVRVPLGVVGIICESRPDVTSDSAAICLKSGNAAIIRGGSDAINSNIALGEILRNALKTAEVPKDAIQVIQSTDRSLVEELMQMRQFIDVLIPRGGADLIRRVVEKARIPVIETGTGNCHIYVEQDADFEKSIPIIINAKVQRPGACNAVEKLLINQSIASQFLPKIVMALRAEGVQIRGDKTTLKLVPDAIEANEEDWLAEYLDLIIAIKIVENMDEAIAHINKYGSKHSDAILTSSFENAQRFLSEVDSAAVYWNASTRFTDGNQFGLGAEIGISTQKIHARGPMSIQNLTSTKYIVVGNWHTRR